MTIAQTTKTNTKEFMQQIARKKRGAYFNNGDNQYSRQGLDDIRLMLDIEKKQEERLYRKPTDLVLGTFGIKTDDGHDITMTWVVDGWRIDKRHGAIDPIPADPYAMDLFNSMFKGWK